MRTIDRELRDNIEYCNLWGDTETPEGRTMYASPEQAAEWDRTEWLYFAASVGALLMRVTMNPEQYDPGDDEALLGIMDWAFRMSL